MENAGAVAIKGFVVQVVVAVLEVYGSDWSTLTVEPPTDDGDLQMVDILWQFSNGEEEHVQVKSSINSFQANKITEWAHELASGRRARRKRLVLVGVMSAGGVRSAEHVNVEVSVRPNDVDTLLDACAHQLSGHLEATGERSTSLSRRRAVEALAKQLLFDAPKSRVWSRNDVEDFVRRANRAALATEPVGLAANAELEDAAKALSAHPALRDPEVVPLCAALAGIAVTPSTPLDLVGDARRQGRLHGLLWSAARLHGAFRPPLTVLAARDTEHQLRLLDEQSRPSRPERRRAAGWWAFSRLAEVLSFADVPLSLAELCATGADETLAAYKVAGGRGEPVSIRDLDGGQLLPLAASVLRDLGPVQKEEATRWLWRLHPGGSGAPWVLLTSMVPPLATLHELAELDLEDDGAAAGTRLLSLDAWLRNQDGWYSERWAIRHAPEWLPGVYLVLAPAERVVARAVREGGGWWIAARQALELTPERGWPPMDQDSRLLGLRAAARREGRPAGRAAGKVWQTALGNEGSRE